MSSSDGKPSGGLGSLFGGLFGPAQSAKAKEEYQRALEKAAREVATWDEAKASNKPASNQKESEPKCWIN